MYYCFSSCLHSHFVFTFHLYSSTSPPSTALFHVSFSAPQIVSVLSEDGSVERPNILPLPWQHYRNERPSWLLSLILSTLLPSSHALSNLETRIFRFKGEKKESLRYLHVGLHVYKVQWWPCLHIQWIFSLAVNLLCPKSRSGRWVGVLLSFLPWT